MTTVDARTGYASVNGLDMYFEVHGTGRPLVLRSPSAIPISAEVTLPTCRSRR
jgi:hypothetical protein